MSPGHIWGVSALLELSDTALTSPQSTDDNPPVRKQDSKAIEFSTNHLRDQIIPWLAFFNASVTLFICIFKAMHSYLINYQIVSHQDE